MAESPVIRLYSRSPRRGELLQSVGIPFTVHPVDADETPPPGSSAPDTVIAIALRKLNAGLASSPDGSNHWGLAADTLVQGEAGLMGKPENRESARRMLASLSGRRHRVHSAFALYAPAKEAPGIDAAVHTTEVEFRHCSPDEIELYLDYGEWKGAAGAYRIQGRGAFFITSIQGLQSAVAGLPLNPLYGMLSAAFYPFGKGPGGGVAFRS